jgi:formylglycine-generating enzyme required for sulfatase activity
MRFIYIQPGQFLMGSPKDEPERFDREKQHKVILTEGFYMQETPVTQGQWEAVMGNNPSRFKEGGPECPVEQVSWEDAREFLQKLNEKSSELEYRLPTEAQWEYACRAGTTTPFWTGECLSTDEANYDGNNPLKGCPKGVYREKTTPVKKFAPNPWGLYDMHGNVWEWCADWFGDYPDGPVTDPNGPSDGADRVYRGGSWINYAGSCRSAYRYHATPDLRNYNLGFRALAVRRRP